MMMKLTPDEAVDGDDDETTKGGMGNAEISSDSSRRYLQENV